MCDVGDMFEYTSDQDRFFNYSLWEYRPSVPYRNKFRSANLLFHSFEVEKIDQGAFQLVNRIREAIGHQQTVWGIKKSGDILEWEFYFYDYRRRARHRSVTRILDAIKPEISSDLDINENLFYFMFSIDINPLLFADKRLTKLHIYIGNPGSNVSSGMSYLCTTQEFKLENFYFFFNPRAEMNEIIGKVVNSVCIDTTQIHIDEIIWPELRNCRTVCIANKQGTDCIYFSGINLEQFMFFLSKMNYKKELISLVENNSNMVDHLLFDVGIDYKMHHGRLVYPRSGYYGIF